MKKVGIITIVNVNNYGAELQAFATFRKLQLMGYNAEIINYLYYKDSLGGMDMMFFNKKSEIDKIREDIEGVILYFKKDNELIDDRIKELYRSINTVEQLSNDKINREVSYIERRIDEINYDIKILTNIGLGIIGLVTVILCVIIAYVVNH